MPLEGCRCLPAESLSRPERRQIIVCPIHFAEIRVELPTGLMRCPSPGQFVMSPPYQSSSRHRSGMSLPFVALDLVVARQAPCQIHRGSIVAVVTVVDTADST
jgi:hypothetical protein